MKRILFAVLAVFLAWSLMDIEIHGIILAPAYAATPQLWRPVPEMKTVLMYLTVFVAAAAFVLIYAWLVSEKSVKKGVLYGFLFGVGSGVSLGYGSYAVMPLHRAVALGWFLGTVVEAVVAGWLMGVIVKRPRERSTWLPFGIRERGDYIK